MAPRSIWNGNNSLLADRLGLAESPRRIHEAGLEGEGRIVVRGDEKVEDAYIVITKYRAGTTYVKLYPSASKPRLRVLVV